MIDQENEKGEKNRRGRRTEDGRRVLEREEENRRGYWNGIERGDEWKVEEEGREDQEGKKGDEEKMREEEDWEEGVRGGQMIGRRIGEEIDGKGKKEEYSIR